MSTPAIRATALPPSCRLGSAFVALSLSAATSHAAANPPPVELAPVEVNATAGPKVDHSASPKYTQPLLDIPQTINIIPDSLMEEQNAHGLRQVLSNVSGVTFNAGEGGGGSGDNINIRGFNASANIQFDGLRDSAQAYRNDLFNMESVEVIKGPNSVFGGAGTTGGSINLISKRPRQEDFIRAETGLGTDHYRRLTLDANQTLPAAGAAWRLNVMAHGNDVPGRGPVDRKRWGFAPSLKLGLDGPTQWTLSYFYQTDRNLPDYGVPARDGRPLAGRHAYFGWRNLDRERVHSHIATSEIQHRFDSGLTLQNLTRYSHLDRDTVVSASHINVAGLPAGRYKPAGPQGYGRNTATTLFANQTHLNMKGELLGMAHELGAGLELSRETYRLQNSSYNLGSHFPANGYPLADPPGYWSGPRVRTNSSWLRSTLLTRALYLTDSIALAPAWDLSLGLRHDWIEGRARAPGRSAGTENRHTSKTRAFSGRAALSYKPADNGRVYLAYGSSFNPSSENLVTNGRGLSAATSDLAPERNHSWELGTKWDVLERQLALNAALFQVTKQNARERQVDGSNTLSGKQRVRGLELGATGKLTPQWEIYAGYTYLHSRTVKFATRPAQEGKALANTPSHSLSLWTSYAWPSGWKAGYGIRAVGKRAVSSSGGGDIPGYAVHSLMVGYTVNANLSLQLNVDNLTNKAYIERARLTTGSDTRSSAVEFGDGRSAMLSAFWRY
ncbi:TonB-dependent receptor [Bordetella pseudohinzii]|uniref:TonB-dependent receptor n=1 Tax=Bordetella pseudohinzii TaxID=1331258 RepID=A0A0J6C8W4_9BORD|nr:TonB-dependent siderophore receptor [Bordetella pseudohinzii]ANY15543.1 TonB-dependent receptor [Bordetella pseudohinzii]KMM27136.1 TonB-dependent receptor [Bordetella pseudohinzii]KXA79812.1 TonB-dependent receptor [Bordetella pseudohinzii]KXA82670.1 TonB-dependent receptor [Bordetella pseudohinzii]CUI83692.1 Virulence-associated outer membrane protein Vir-90 [Bordetella pseudohinzii]